MGWTLGRYFFFRYATITAWFFVGVYALITLIDFTEFSSRTGAVPGFTFELALAVSALRVPMIMQQTVPFVAPVRGDGDAGLAQPQVRAGHRPLGRHLGLAVPVSVLPRRAALRAADRRRAQSARRVRDFRGRK